MKKLCEKGSAVLFSSHILDVVEKCCNKITILKNGECVAAGKIQDILGEHNLEEIFVELSDNENHQ